MATYQSSHTGAEIDAAVDEVATKLPLAGGTLTGELNANGYIKAAGDIFMAPTTPSTNADSQKIWFRTHYVTDTTKNMGPYIQGVTETGGFGKKRLSVFQVSPTSTSYTDAYIEAFTVLPNGNVGIGTTTPTAKLHVDGDAVITGGLSLGGQAVVSVFSGSTAPSSSTGSNGDIYIQTT